MCVVHDATGHGLGKGGLYARVGGRRLPAACEWQRRDVGSAVPVSNVLTSATIGQAEVVGNIGALAVLCS